MKIAIMGFGVVGTGVAEIITQNAAIIKKNSAKKIEIKYILDIRKFPDSPFNNLIIDDFDKILNDPEITTVAEVMGGINPAFDYVSRLLKKGKNVVTSNKELVAQKGAILLKIAKENNTNFLFEASVGGGIPVIRPLNQCLTANKIIQIAGILNGTTNYILTKMIEDGKAFSEVLKETQELGYAEKNPDADVLGIDACRKIAILSSLSCGKHIYPDFVHTEGITNITLDDVRIAKEAGYVIKLIGQAKFHDDNSAFIMVSPCLVPLNNPMSSVNDVFNAICIKGNFVDDVMFYGKGAGKLPTASAVVADIIDCAKHLTNRKWVDWEDSDCSFVTDYKLEPSSFMLVLKNKEIDLRKFFSETIISNEFSVIINDITQKELEEKLEKNNIEIITKFRILDI
ncbi:MAG: homoserine dehydrogenase [Clostridia bacterium]